MWVKMTVNQKTRQRTKVKVKWEDAFEESPSGQYLGIIPQEKMKQPKWSYGQKIRFVILVVIIVVIVIILASYLHDPEEKEPEAVIIVSKTVIYQGDSVTFNSKESYDSDGKIESYKWQIELETFTQETFDYTFDSIGEFNVTLTVTDNDKLKDSDNIIIKVQKALSIIVIDEENRENFLGKSLYHMKIQIQNKGNGTLQLNRPTIYFWIIKNGTKYDGELEDNYQIKPKDYTMIEVNFFDFPLDKKPEELIFKFNENYQDTLN